MLVKLLPKLTDPDAIAAWVKAVDEKTAREFALEGDPETLAAATEIELISLEVKSERVAELYIEGTISKSKHDEKLARQG